MFQVRYGEQLVLLFGLINVVVIAPLAWLAGRLAGAAGWWPILIAMAAGMTSTALAAFLFVRPFRQTAAWLHGLTAAGPAVAVPTPLQHMAQIGDQISTTV